MAVKSPIARILIRSLATTVLFVVLYGIYLTIGRQPVSYTHLRAHET